MNCKLQRLAARTAHMLLYAAALTVPVNAQQAPPMADAFALSARPNANYGNSAFLAVSAGATSFMQFNLSTIPASATVSKATLRLYVNAVAGAGSFDIYEVDTPWAENPLNFTNTPATGLPVTGSRPVSIGPSNSDQFVLVDVTSLVQEWVNGTVANNGLALKLASATGGFSFDSKESM